MLTVRVTEVLDYFQPPHLVDWKLRVGKAEASRVSRTALKHGARMDEIVKNNLAPKPKDADEVKVAYGAYLKWRSVYGEPLIEPLSRMNVELDGVMVSGEPDFMALGRLTDLKAANRISLSYWVQVNIYAYLRLILGMDSSPKPVAILRLDKTTGSFEYVTKPFDECLVNVWRGLLKAYVYYKESEDDVDV